MGVMKWVLFSIDACEMRFGPTNKWMLYEQFCHVFQLTDDIVEKLIQG